MDFALADGLQGMPCLPEAFALNLKWVDELFAKDKGKCGGDGATSPFRGDMVCVPCWVGVGVSVT